MAPLDVNTLVLVSSLILGALGVLFLVNHRDDPSRRELRDWGLGFLVVVPGVMLIGERDRLPDLWSLGVANAVVLSAYGFLTVGVMRFVGRPPSWLAAFGGVAVWAGLCLWPPFFERFDLRVIAMSVLCGLQVTLATAILVGRRRVEPLPSLERAASVLGGVAVLLWVRAGLMALWPIEATGTAAIRTVWLTWASLALLVLGLIAGHLMLAMSAERAEVRHRLRAETDDLTGALSRGAFVERARERLAEAPESGTLMFFDIDRFKSINDRHGHAVGDAVLVGFADLVAARLRPGDVFARWGGEEFVLFAADRDFLAGRRAAEEIRRAFAEMRFGPDGTPLAATVSIGLSAPALAGPDLERLLAWADAGVYAAKRAGRDRVETVDPRGAALAARV
ncbi:MAG: GGDEF domain-containing protein [Phyllobacteriaceae bacterium]|nr:GGDEF domain-containing protein [Phyllobacteriaceae bacterium]